MAKLFDRHIAGWREDNFSLRYAISIPREEIVVAHAAAKRELIEYVNRQMNVGMCGDVLTLGFARRAASYKRADLIFNNMEQLRKINREAGKFQLIYGGKAHPNDTEGKELIKQIFRAADQLQNDIKIVYLENYDMSVAKILTAGVDVWLNTPEPPMEASGTSGMKAAINGVPSLSILDGWWIEGCIDGMTGWAIGDPNRRQDDGIFNIKAEHEKDAASLYEKLRQVAGLYYNNKSGFERIMAIAIAMNGSFFNTQRMMQQYVLKAYFE
jgi:starch phosphorylase